MEMMNEDRCLEGAVSENELELLMKKIKKTLSEIAGQNELGALNIDYSVICNCALELLDIVFGEDDYALPIDINAIYKRLNIPIVEMDLNSYMENCKPKRVNRIIGKISIRKEIISGETKRSIYIDENTPPIIQRYAMAHELCHYIMKTDKAMFMDEYCNMPMLPKDSTELIADAFAIFLLIPIGNFLDAFLEYVTNERDSGRPPFRTSDWIEHLSTICYVAEYYVAYGYQEIRYVANWLYSMRNKENAQKGSSQHYVGMEKSILQMKLLKDCFYK